MAIIRRTRRPLSLPLSESFIEDLPERLRHMLEGTLPFEAVQNVSWMPAMTIVEKNGSLLVTAELPGIAPESVDITVEDDLLTISGEKVEEKTEDDKDAQFYLWERRYGSFRRSFTLPHAVEVDKITAQYTKGVLTITLPKAATVAPKGRKITVVEKK